MPKKRVIPAAQRAAIEVVRARADERAAKLAPVIKALRAKGVTTRVSEGSTFHGDDAATRRARPIGARSFSFGE
jgi:hypothetical protein